MVVGTALAKSSLYLYPIIAILDGLCKPLILYAVLVSFLDGTHRNILKGVQDDDHAEELQLVEGFVVSNGLVVGNEQFAVGLRIELPVFGHDEVLSVALDDIGLGLLDDVAALGPHVEVRYGDHVVLRVHVGVDAESARELELELDELLAGKI